MATSAQALGREYLKSAQNLNVPQGGATSRTNVAAQAARDAARNAAGSAYLQSNPVNSNPAPLRSDLSSYKPTTPITSAKTSSTSSGGGLPAAGNSMAYYSSSSPSNSDSQLQAYIDMLSTQSYQNSAFNAEQAEINRNWQAKQTQLAMDYNTEEAAKARNWTEVMSNSAHQREIADLKAAGLNPVLSASGGNGAAVTSGVSASSHAGTGSSASADTSANASIASVLSTVLGAQNQLELARINTANQLAVAEKYTATSELIGRLQAGASYGAAVLNQQGQNYRQEQQFAHDIRNPSSIEGWIAKVIANIDGGDLSSLGRPYR